MDRTNMLVYGNVKFSQIDAGIASCEKCYRIHRKAKNQSVFIGILMGRFLAAIMGLIGWRVAVWTNLSAVGIIF